MAPQSFFNAFVLTNLLVIATSGFAIEKDKNDCGAAPSPVRITLRHMEGKGVGYNQGYTTLESFLSPINPWKDAWVPFLDIRGHLFNNGKPAANAGIGVRYLTDSRVWGVNSYYDYRKTSRQHYNQVSLGFESLGEIWDFRLNGYLPVGDKTSSFFDTRFDQFKGHSIILHRKREFAMKGVNAEVGAHVDKIKNLPFYFAAGPYFLEGKGKTAWGGEARAALDIFSYARVEGNVSYDNVFKWIGQGQISVSIPFGKKRKVMKQKGVCCSTSIALSNRALQRVDRNEIVPVDNQHKRSVAIDPATGQPYFVIFVDSLSSSNGTFESPYPELSTAQMQSKPGDIIYVFPGNGSPYEMNNGVAGFQMKDDQRLWGSATSHTIATQLGTITIPQQSENLPMVTSLVSSSAVITMANNCEVAGMNIIGTDIQFGIVGGFISPIANGTVRDNQIAISSVTGNSSGIEISSSGNLSIINNTISSISSSSGASIGIVAVNIVNGSSSIMNNNISNISSSLGSVGIFIENFFGGEKYTIANNNISNFSSSTNSQGFAAVNVSDETTFLIANNSISNISSLTLSEGIGVADTSSGSTFSILNNNLSFISSSTTTNGIIINNDLSGEKSTLISNNNLFFISAPTSQGINVTNNGGATTCLTLIENTALPQIVLDNVSGKFNLNPASRDNSPTPTRIGTIHDVSCP